MSWHLNNPVNGLTAWDTTRNTVRAMLPGGAQHATFVAYLSRLADFMQAAQASWFKPIPIIFRPFHENTGSWFWWGKKQCTPDEYKALFRFTIDYLRRERRVHNLLIAYSPAEFDSPADFMTRYPGDEYVDIIGFDAYYRGDGSAFRADMDRQLPALLALANEHHKVAALTETGFDQIPEPEWWTKTLLPYLQQYSLAYVLVWRNGPTGHYFAPSPGQVSTQDFQAFYRAPKVLFQDKLTPLRVYKKR
ncbi:glycoside hydrolase family 26 protein [Hymenobacter volaticus]|uniref:glycoside hydrolase family 26 protein n=1 Tax=Hymenobacter volaticus TaxID=2932254 RepID=UPI0024686C83|nr:glycosyl hydrolase [Hymenobacter volaticus]